MNMVIWGKHIEYRRVLRTTAAFCNILYRTVKYDAIQYNAVQYSDGSTQYCKNKIVPWHNYSNILGNTKSIDEYSELPPHSAPYSTAQWNTVQYSTMQCSIVTEVHSSVNKSQHSKYGNRGETQRASTSTQNYRRILQYTLPHSEIRCNTVQCSAV